MSQTIDTELILDPVAWPLMTELVGCMCTELAESSSRELCFCGVLVGETVDGSLAGYGNCKGGMAWVRAVNVFPSTVFPNPDLLASCVTLLAVQLEVGVLRPMLLPQGRKLPTQGEMAVAAQQAMSDMAALHRAISCCVRTSKSDFVYQLGEWAPIGPEGGLVGGSWTFTFQQEF